jgi:predicted Zn-dependent protease
MAQGIGVVLILIATGDLEDALADERFQGMLAGAFAPLGNEGGDEGAQAERMICLGQPGQAAIGRKAAAIEGSLHGQ